VRGMQIIGVKNPSLERDSKVLLQFIRTAPTIYITI
jgi:hypothetical protein